jgi:hypothetical protein
MTNEGCSEVYCLSSTSLKTIVEDRRIFKALHFFTGNKLQGEVLKSTLVYN